LALKLSGVMPLESSAPGRYCTVIGRVTFTRYEFRLLGTRETENFADSVSYESWMFVIGWIYLVNHEFRVSSVFDGWYRDALMTDCVILIASTAACSSSLGVLRMLVGAMRPFAITKSRCILPWQVVFR
jgi:hypothetical protein